MTLGKAFEPSKVYQVFPLRGDLSKLRYFATLIVPTRMADGRYPVVDAWYELSPIDGFEVRHDVFITPPQRGTRKTPDLRLGWGFIEGPATEFQTRERERLGPYARVHSAGGVEPKQHGLGYTLYCAAGLLAGYLGARFDDRPGRIRSVEGVYSPMASFGNFVPEDEAGAPTPEAEAVWRRLVTIPLGSRPPIAQTVPSFSWAYNAATRSRMRTYYPYNILTTASVLDSGFVVALGPDVSPRYRSHRRIPLATQSRLAYDLKFVPIRPTL